MIQAHTARHAMGLPETGPEILVYERDRIPLLRCPGNLFHFFMVLIRAYEKGAGETVETIFHGIFSSFFNA
jgi:hypothetical protein